MAKTWAQTQAYRLSSIIAALAFGLIVVAGLDLGANGIESAAPRALPSASFGTTHLALALLTATATLGLVGMTWVRRRDEPRDFHAALFASSLMLMLAVATAFTGSSSAEPWVAAVQFGMMALLLGSALSVTIDSRARAWIFPRPGVIGDAGLRALHGLAILASAAVFAVLTTGAFLGASDSPKACSGWPLCSLETGGVSLLHPQNAHRILVAASGLLLIVLVLALLRSRARLIAPLALLSIFAAEALTGAFSAGDSHSAVVSGAHFSAAGAAWAVLVAIGLAIRPAPSSQPAFTMLGLNAWKAQARDYLRVTKPGIMTLLLITTLGAMLIAPGWPSLWLVLATLLGGALASGGASALNCYLDRDIDVVMARTRKRPIPTGSLTPRQVQIFGLVLSAGAVIELWLLVNPVAALLALAGNLFYVVIYTRFLKRSTPQNIVIGGAAGAFPPLVGWAAATGSVSLTSILLFALIFYWTPPHFWSLALLKARDYERAGIPMLPVTHGEHQTRKHILLYSCMLVAITILVVPAGAAGILYLSIAIALGAVFVGMAARMYLDRSSRLAWRLFKYSNYYLAAILLAMVVDRAVLG